MARHGRRVTVKAEMGRTAGRQAGFSRCGGSRIGGFHTKPPRRSAGAPQPKAFQRNVSRGGAEDAENSNVAGWSYGWLNWTFPPSPHHSITPVTAVQGESGLIKANRVIFMIRLELESILSRVSSVPFCPLSPGLIAVLCHNVSTSVPRFIIQ